MSESRYVISCKTANEIWLYLVLRDDNWEWTQNMDEVTQFLDVETASQIWEDINADIPHDNIDENSIAVRKIIFHRAINLTFTQDIVHDDILEDVYDEQEEEILDETDDDSADIVLSRILPEYDDLDETEDDFITDDFIEIENESVDNAQEPTEQILSEEIEHIVPHLKIEDITTNNIPSEVVTKTNEAITEEIDSDEEMIDEYERFITKTEDESVNDTTEDLINEEIAKDENENNCDITESDTSENATPIIDNNENSFVEQTIDITQTEQPVLHTETDSKETAIEEKTDAEVNEHTDKENTNTNEKTNLEENKQEDAKSTNTDNSINIKALSQGFVDFLDSIDKSNVMETLEKLKGLVDQEVTQMKKKADTEKSEENINDITQKTNVTQTENANHEEIFSQNKKEHEKSTSEILSEIEKDLTISEKENEQRNKPHHNTTEHRNNTQDNGYNRSKNKKRKKKKSGKWSFVGHN